MKLIPLTQGLFAKVDDADYALVSEHKWFAHRVGQRTYAGKFFGRRLVHLHVFLMRLRPGSDGLHDNGDGLDNQRENLKAGTRAQNLRGFCRKRLATTSPFRGVSWNSRKKRWQAQIYVNNKQKYLGLFRDEIEAAKAFDAVAFSNFGGDAQLNFPALTNLLLPDNLQKS